MCVCFVSYPIHCAKCLLICGADCNSLCTFERITKLIVRTFCLFVSILTPGGNDSILTSSPSLSLVHNFQLKWFVIHRHNFHSSKTTDTLKATHEERQRYSKREKDNDDDDDKKKTHENIQRRMPKENTLISFSVRKTCDSIFV